MLNGGVSSTATDLSPLQGRERHQGAAGASPGSWGVPRVSSSQGGTACRRPSPYPTWWVRDWWVLAAPCRGHPASPGSPGLCPTWPHLPAVVEVEDEVRPWGGGKEKLSEGPAVLGHVAGHLPSPGGAGQGRDRTAHGTRGSTRTSPNHSLASESPSLAPEHPKIQHVDFGDRQDVLPTPQALQPLSFSLPAPPVPVPALCPYSRRQHRPCW